ncbi:hypothetical protein DERP_007923 [Dermatophagoides pteronyssinus]|uniref:Sex-determining region Y protein n=1 Tax=Dermatophagoides pteronyssinus TaxID=6956 RepID=A0ABQ8IT88_DERPT|nr:hypothetical protein DERP_007923 [Dermatophagoides pteronyssinus]
MIFAKNRRREILYANPRMTNKEVSKQLGYEWRQLPEDRRTHYKQLAIHYSNEHKNKYPDPKNL